MTDTTISERHLLQAAPAVLRLHDAHRDAVNGLAHPEEPHNTVLGDPHSPISSQVGDCSACAGEEYGIETEQNVAWGDLREILGQERKPWER